MPAIHADGAEDSRYAECHRRRNAEECFEMAGVIPHHGGHAVARLQSEFRQCRREPARAPIEIAINSARDGLVRFAGDDLDARKDIPRTLENGGQRQRKSIMCRALRPLGRGANRANRIINPPQRGKARQSGSGQFARRFGTISVAKGVNSETMQQTAEATVSRLGWLGFSDFPYTIAVSFSAPATRNFRFRGRREQEVKKPLYRANLPFPRRKTSSTSGFRRSA